MPQYEVQANMSLLPLDGPYEVLADGVTLGPAMDNRDQGQPVVPDPPVINTATSSLTSATQATINWAAPAGGGIVTGYELFMDSVIVGATLPGVLTYTYSSVPNDSATHVFKVRAYGAYDSGAFSAQLNLQWSGTPDPPPPAPTNFRFSNVTATTATVAWNMADMTGIAGFRVKYGGGTVLRDLSTNTALTTNLTGLTQGTTYPGVYVVSVDTDGDESGPSNTQTIITTGGGGGGGVTQRPVMGMNAVEAHPRQFDDYKAWRIYNWGQADTNTAVGRGATIVAVTDNAGGPASGSSGAMGLNTYLDWFHNGSGNAARANCEVHFAPGNEVDRDYTTGALPTAVVSTWSAMWDVVTSTTGGVRDYPRAKLGVDMTQHQIDINGSGPRFKAIARYCHFFACSMYAPGRRVTNNNSQNGDTFGPFYNPYADYCDYVFAALADWRTSGGAGGSSLATQLTEFATWEFGIPIDNALTDGSPRTGANATNFSVRPRYVAGGIDSYGNNWAGFLQYIYNKCVQIDVVMREQCYWNQQSNADIPNMLSSDAQPRANPDTEHAWHNWTPGSRLPNA